MPLQREDALFMSDVLLEGYICQHIEACSGPVIQFSWHGGEPALFGVDGFRRIVDLQKKHCPEGRQIANGIQTNGTLLDEPWCEFLAKEGFAVGLSLDGPEQFHDQYRVTAQGQPTFVKVLEAYERLQRHGIATEILCVVNAHNVQHPVAVYEFFRGIDVRFLTCLPLVERLDANRVSERTVQAEAWGEFLCTIFDLWQAQDIGRLKVQIFEEALRTAFGLEHSLCIFRKTCGGVPVLETNGDLYSCDHYVTPEHKLGNLNETSLGDLLTGPQQQAFGRVKWESLCSQCRDCEVLAMCHGGCPKNRFVSTPHEETSLNHLCAGYKQFFLHCTPFIETLAQVWKDMEHDTKKNVWTAAIDLKENASHIDFFSNHHKTLQYKSRDYPTYISSPYTRVRLVKE